MERIVNRTCSRRTSTKTLIFQVFGWFSLLLLSEPSVSLEGGNLLCKGNEIESNPVWVLAIIPKIIATSDSFNCCPVLDTDSLRTCWKTSGVSQQVYPRSSISELI